MLENGGASKNYVLILFEILDTHYHSNLLMKNLKKNSFFINPSFNSWTEFGRPCKRQKNYLHGK
jgi:hypothetical protein